MCVYTTIDVYIGRCDKYLTGDILIEHIKDEINVDVIDCKCLSSHDSLAKAFKLTVLPNGCNKLLDSELWLENIRVRKVFSRFRN